MKAWCQHWMTNCIAIFILYLLKINNFINVGSKLKVGARDKPAIFNAYVMSIFAKMPPSHRSNSHEFWQGKLEKWFEHHLISMWEKSNWTLKQTQKIEHWRFKNTKFIIWNENIHHCSFLLLCYKLSFVQIICTKQ